MAGRVVPMNVGGMELLVETTLLAGTEQTSVNLGKARVAVAEAFDQAQSAIIAVAASTVKTISHLGGQALRPDEVTVTFGLKFSAQGSVIVASAAGEATLEVTLAYRRDPDPDTESEAIESTERDSGGSNSGHDSESVIESTADDGT